jgi:hypothetical protein
MHSYHSDQKQWNLPFTHLSFSLSHSSLSQKAKATSEISHVSFSLVNYHAFLSLWPSDQQWNLSFTDLSFFFSHSSLYILNLSPAKSTEHSPKAVQISSLSSIIYSLLSFFFRDQPTMSTPPTWKMYVEDHLMRKENNHQLKAGAIIGPKGHIWSQSEEFPSV